ncbi:hypothetical protein V5F66_21710, partial [Xanthobacter sp. V2C-9]
ADLYVEKVKVLVTTPAAAGVLVLGEDLGALIEEGPSDPDLVKAIEADLERFMLATNTALGEAIESGREHINDEAVENWEPEFDAEAAFA